MANHRYRGDRLSDNRIRICTYAGTRFEPAEYVELIRCPWCGDWHSSDDDICEAWPVEPPTEQITEEDINDWHDWIGQVAS